MVTFPFFPIFPSLSLLERDDSISGGDGERDGHLVEVHGQWEHGLQLKM